MAKRKLCELRKELIDDKQMRAIMEAVFIAVDTRPKNACTVKRKPSCKGYK